MRLARQAAQENQKHEITAAQTGPEKIFFLSARHTAGRYQMDKIWKHVGRQRRLCLVILFLLALPACVKPGTEVRPASGAVLNDETVDANLQPLSSPPPRYPELARGRGHEGTVFVEADVDERGVPSAVRVRQSSGHTMLDEAAVAAVDKWRFRPALSAGKTVPRRVIVPIEFRLKKS
jgi:TonB family protein